MSTRRMAVLWDLDGTLVDSQADIFDCLCSSVEAAGLPVEKIREQLRIGPTVDVLIRQAFPEISVPCLTAVIAGFRKLYDYSDFPQTAPFVGIDSLVRSIPFADQFIITNKPQLPCARIIRKFKWDHIFKGVYTPDIIGPTRRLTKTELFVRVIREHRLVVRECLAVGDTVGDIQAAHAADIRAIGVSWGYNLRHELARANAEAVAVSVEELFALLNAHPAPPCLGEEALLQ